MGYGYGGSLLIIKKMNDQISLFWDYGNCSYVWFGVAEFSLPHLLTLFPGFGQAVVYCLMYVLWYKLRGNSGSRSGWSKDKSTIYHNILIYLSRSPFSIVKNQSFSEYWPSREIHFHLMSTTDSMQYDITHLHILPVFSSFFMFLLILYLQSTIILLCNF